MEIDTTVYPDREQPTEPWTLEDRADSVHRICGAFDFGVPPEGATLRLLRAWKDVFDRFPLSHSPAYHALRVWYGWEPVARTEYSGEPGYIKLDLAEGRVDGFEDRV